MSDNIILFPGIKKYDTTPQSVEEIVDKVTQTRKDHVDMVMNDVIPEMIHVFGSYGIDIQDDKYVKDVAMIIESIKSLLSRQYKLDHPFHEMVDNIFQFSYNEDNSIAYSYVFPTKEEE